MSMTEPMSMTDRMRADLREAMKRRAETAVSTIRSVLADIANAEAVEAAPASASEAPLDRVGLSRDVARRALSPR